MCKHKNFGSEIESVKQYNNRWREGELAQNPKFLQWMISIHLLMQI
jgi:hypothetical protein